MRNTKKDKYWREMIRKQGELRHFGSMAIRKSSKGDYVSAQEADLLFRVALAGGVMTPGQLAVDMGVSKTIISRLIDSLEKKGFIERERTLADRRSYVVRVTEDGKEEVDQTYYYYLDPLYTLREQMEAADFEKLFCLIEEANTILNKANSKASEKVRNI